MRKTFLMVAALMGCMLMQAASYGILVNGKMYFAGSLQDEFEGFTQYLAHVQVKSGDYCQLYDADNKAAWAVALNTYSVAGFTYDASANRYTVSVDGCYDFYIKLKYKADELYIGAGANCGEGQDISGGGDIDPGYSGAVPAQCPDVMLQAFYYESTTDKGHGRTKWVDHLNGNNGSSAEEIGQWFDLVWLPPMSKSEGGMGYHPTNYGVLNGDWGTDTKLKQLITTLHQNGARVVADIVINHAGAQEGWCDFKSYTFGTYGTFTPDGSYICNTDEVNTSAPTTACRGYATGNADDGYGNEANYASARDWDHKNTNVQNMFKAYLNWLRNEIKVDGFRYDYCKGFHHSHINDYNTAAKAYFSVMEYWDGNVETLKYHLTDAGKNTAAFDFNMKYNAFNDGIASENYCALKGAGLPGAGYARYAVTFVDSHDTYQRGSDSEFCGNGNSMTICKDKIKQCYAYMLSMPGVPCVFWPHWVTFKEQLKPLINARYKTGVHSESSVSDECGNGYYKATITGTNGEIRLLLGPNSGYNSTPSGYTLAGKGTNYGVYYKTTSARGDKNTERKDRTQGIEDVESGVSKVKSEKFIENGQLYIRCGEQVFDIMGRLVK
ncbi:MAG: alpha-amylase family glycosyl hydrolase [Paludibacteraceae bacterium]|nr:alpha-amylase family glycosyl hydrolase [Paludibacteraceae bacterium]MDD6747444.1 alpha-amylase family glycosyl hydrolase [Paludibacteraceae bacterium]